MARTVNKLLDYVDKRQRGATRCGEGDEEHVGEEVLDKVGGRQKSATRCGDGGGELLDKVGEGQGGPTNYGEDCAERLDKVEGIQEGATRCGEVLEDQQETETQFVTQKATRTKAKRTPCCTSLEAPGPTARVPVGSPPGREGGGLRRQAKAMLTALA